MSIHWFIYCLLFFKLLVVWEDREDHISSFEPQLPLTPLPLSSLTVISLLYIIKLSQHTSFILVICFCIQSMFIQNQFILDSLLFTTVNFYYCWFILMFSWHVQLSHLYNKVDSSMFSFLAISTSFE